MLAERHQVGERLRGVVDVALQVDHRDVGPPCDLAHVRVPLPRHQVVTDREAVPVPGQDDAHVLGALTMRDLRLLSIEVMRVTAELGHPGLEGVPRPCGLIEEQHEQRLVRQEPVRLIRLEGRLQLARDRQGLVDLLHAPVERLDVVAACERRSVGHGSSPPPVARCDNKAPP